MLRLASTPVLTATTVLMSLFFISCANSQPSGDDRRGPPKAALSACVDKQAEEACSFTGRRGDLSGICYTPSDEKPLACKPSGKRPEKPKDE